MATFPEDSMWRPEDSTGDTEGDTLSNLKMVNSSAAVPAVGHTSPEKSEQSYVTSSSSPDGSTEYVKVNVKGMANAKANARCRDMATAKAWANKVTKLQP